MAADVTIGDKTFIIGKMPAETQFHVFRRAMPLLKPILESLKQGIKFGPLMLVQISGELSQMKDDDLNYVIRECKNVVSVMGPTGKAMPLMVNGNTMFADFDLPMLMQLTWAVLMENFRPFLSGLLGGPSNAEAPTPATS